MTNQWFRVPKDIIFGKNSLSYLSELTGKRAMLVTGGHSMKRLGFLDEATRLLKNAGMDVAVVDGVEPNPSIKTVIRGGREMSAFQPDWIIAIGGGSALDAAKIMWVFYEYPDYSFTELVKMNFPKLRTKARFVAIPSTSGTASEITAFSVITDTETHIKYPLVSYEITPDIAILDPVIAATMPKHITANTGVDVLTHAIEAYVSTNASSFTDPLAVEAISLVFKNLEDAWKNGDNMTAREHMHNASTLAGMAFTNSSLGLVHSMAHKIGGEFGVTHGLANAILLPTIVEYNSVSTMKYNRLEKILGIPDLPKAIRDLNTAVGIAPSFKSVSDIKITEQDLSNVLNRMSTNAYNDPCTLTNPRKTNIEDIQMIYRCAYSNTPLPQQLLSGNAA